MKYLYLFSLILFLNSSTVIGNDLKEQVYVYTDKECYVAGEDIWLKFYVADQQFKPCSISKVGYVEICDVRKPHIQVKLALENGKGGGKITIPRTLPGGVYQLTAYTRYMRNFGEESFFNRKIAIINVTQPFSEGRLLLLEDKERSGTLPEGEKNSFVLLTDKEEYEPREKVMLSWEHLPNNLEDIVISVYREDSLIGMSELKNIYRGSALTHYSSFEKLSFLPEYEGHIIEGQIYSKEMTTYNNLVVNLGVVGQDIKYMHGRINPENGAFTFYTGDIYNKREVVTSVTSYDNSFYSVDLKSPFHRALPDELPILKLYPNQHYLTERLIGLQLTDIRYEDSNGNLLPIENYYNIPTNLSYDLDEYTRFPTMSETFVEFVKRIIVRRVDGQQRIKVLMEGKGYKFNAGNTLVLLDGVPIHDHEVIINYNPRLIKKINIYNGKYLFGGDMFDCMVSFISNRQNLPTVKLTNEYQLLEYEFPLSSDTFLLPDYEKREDLNSRKPDFRHTLYWEPFLSKSFSSSGNLSFYTSDLCGQFKVVMEGIDNEGKCLNIITSFNVKKR